MVESSKTSRIMRWQERLAPSSCPSDCQKAATEAQAGTIVPVEITAITDPTIYKKVPEGPGVTAWKKGTNVVTAKWNPMYATLQGMTGLIQPSVSFFSPA